MPKYTKYQELKDLLKERAKYITNQRATARGHKAVGEGLKAHSINLSVIADARWFRHHHIAYCELCGRTRDQIEKPRDGNEPDQYTIEAIKKQYQVYPEVTDDCLNCQGTPLVVLSKVRILVLTSPIAT